MEETGGDGVAKGKDGVTGKGWGGKVRLEWRKEGALVLPPHGKRKRRTMVRGSRDDEGKEKEGDSGKWRGGRRTDDGE